MRITQDVHLTLGELAAALRARGLALFRVFPDSSRIERGDFNLSLASAMAAEAKGVPEGMVKIDPPPVSRDAAVEIVVHHLAIAATYFEATPEDYGKQIEEEVRRQVKLGCLSKHQADAMAAFVGCLDAYYEGLKAEDKK